jgi:hypothetical protein
MAIMGNVVANCGRFRQRKRAGGRLEHSRLRMAALVSTLPGSSVLAFARALEVPYQSRKFIVLAIEVGHREIESLRQPLQGLQVGLPTYPSSVHGKAMLIDVTEF